MAEAWRDVGPGDLVAVREPPGPEWFDIVESAWSRGAAILPIDTRLTAEEGDARIDRARPTHWYEPGGITRRAEGEPVSPETALVIATSGTSGEPKLVDLSREALEAAVHAANERIGNGRWLLTLPPAHIAALLVFLRGVLLGPAPVVHPRFDPEVFEADRRCDYTLLVPTMLYRLLEAGVDLTRFDVVLVGGAPLTEQLAARSRDAGVKVVDAYGLTETCGGVVYDGAPLRGARMRMGDRGGIELGGEMLMRGYLRDPEASADAVRDGWLRTNDAGELDEMGRLRVLGRLDDVIVSGGENVWPEEVENALRAHPRVADVAIVGREDPEWGRAVVALVVPAAGASPPDLEELRAFGARAVARYKLPRALVLTDALPRTSSGKLRRNRLDLD
ncbi:MAG: AMP-binding protein [Actinobacteria bacterium]|nr:AMP-binding protein [Actinomycetota bacterium]